ncbi:hypothetical protein CK203_101525 [Vitis vinifera]|uniref:Reverse transcriptase Ty1/copia-type domain-containing protein n=1 Tax=Vitis vinifera TaxID=29760 RepID=A0A438DVF7_VITVI|nr:hypothetical protein CK203_101525 [Vitis vinifera]
MVNLPKGKTTVGCKWVFAVKFKSDGTLEDIRLVWWPRVLLKLIASTIQRRDDLDEMNPLKKNLATEFEFKDLEALKYFLRMEDARSRKKEHLQTMYRILRYLKSCLGKACSSRKAHKEIGQVLLLIEVQQRDITPMCGTI